MPQRIAPGTDVTDLMRQPALSSGQDVTAMMGQQATSVPAPPEHSLLGFAGNAIKSGAKLAWDTAKGVGSINTNPVLAAGKMAYHAATDPAAFREEARGYAAAIPHIPAAVGSYLNDYSPSNIGETMYNDPFRVISDVSMVTPLGEAALAGKFPRAAKALGAISKLDISGNMVEGAVNATKGAYRAVKNQRALKGAPAANESFFNQVLDPTFNPRQPNKIATVTGAGNAVRTEMAKLPTNAQKQAAIAKQAGTDSMAAVNPKGVDPRAIGGQVKNEVRKVMDAEDKGIQNAYEQVFAADDFGSQRLRHAQGTFSPSIKEMHEMRGDDLAAARATKDPKDRRNLMKSAQLWTQRIKAAADQNGMASHFNAYMSANEAKRKWSRRYLNKPVKAVLDSPDEMVPDVFAGRSLPTMKGDVSFHTDNYPNEKTIGHFQDIIGPQRFEDLQGAVGGRLAERSADLTSGNVNPAALAKKLQAMEMAGKSGLVPAGAGPAVVGQAERVAASKHVTQLSKDIESLGDAATDSNEIIDRLMRSRTQLDIVKQHAPHTLKQIQGAVGQTLKARFKTGDYMTVQPLDTALDALNRAGVLEDLVPNHVIVRDVVTVLKNLEMSGKVENAGRFMAANAVAGMASSAAAGGYYGGLTGALLGGTAYGVTAVVLNRLLKKHQLKPRDIGLLVKQLQKDRSPAGRAVAQTLRKFANPAAAISRIQERMPQQEEDTGVPQIPNPPGAP